MNFSVDGARRPLGQRHQRGQWLRWTRIAHGTTGATASWRERRPVLAGHAAFETYAVLTRMPPLARRPTCNRPVDDTRAAGTREAERRARHRLRCHPTALLRAVAAGVRRTDQDGAVPADDALLTLLHELDDPRNPERPLGFDPEVASQQFNDLHRALSAAFRCECVVDAWPNVQDASHWGRLVIPAASTLSGADLVILVSNFWPLAMVAVDNPGVHDEEEFERLLDAGDRGTLEQALLDAGHVIVPERLLDRRYNGSASVSSFRTWFERYFDYL